MACLESAIFSIDLDDDHNEKNICQEGGAGKNKIIINPLTSVTFGKNDEAIDKAIEFFDYNSKTTGPTEKSLTEKSLIEKSKTYLKHIKSQKNNIVDFFKNIKLQKNNIVEFFKNFYQYFFIHEYILKNIFPTTSGDREFLIDKTVTEKKFFDKDTLKNPIEKFKSLFDSSNMRKVSSVFDIDFVKSQYEKEHHEKMLEAKAVSEDNKKKYSVLYDESIISKVVVNILRIEGEVGKAFEKSRSIREDFKNLDQHLHSVESATAAIEKSRSIREDFKNLYQHLQSVERATAAIEKSVELVQEMELGFLTFLDELVFKKNIVTKETDFFRRKHKKLFAKKYRKSRISFFAKKPPNYKIDYKNLYVVITELKNSKNLKN